MDWHPVGPDFVFAPRNAAYNRLSRRNEMGRQAMVLCIAPHPANPDIVYLVARPQTGGAAAFRTSDAGNSWTCISDVLHRTYDWTLDPFWLAINPSHPETIYLACYYGTCVFVSNDSGASWGAKRPFPPYAFPKKLIVDARTADNLATTHLYAATDTGLYHSEDGGTTWDTNPLVTGNVSSLVAHTPEVGDAQFYAGVLWTGVFRATTNPTTPAGWTNLTTAGVELPVQGAFDHVLIDHCPRKPARAYAWHLIGTATAGLYTTEDPTQTWTQVAIQGKPDERDGYPGLSFAVAPNSPGNGMDDILLFGSGFVQRSIDGGRNWAPDHAAFHEDQHAIAFYPPEPPAGTVPVTYIGCDGGIAKSSSYSDPLQHTEVPPAGFDEGTVLHHNYVWENFNHGLQCAPLTNYAAVRTAPALSYISMMDSGIAGGASALSWRGLDNADVRSVAAAAAPDGVSVWGAHGVEPGWADFQLKRWLDTGEPGDRYRVRCLLGASVLVQTSANLEVGRDGLCYAGVRSRDTWTTLASAITADTYAQDATPANMTNIAPKVLAIIDAGETQEEGVRVESIGTTAFRGICTKNHNAGALIFIERRLVVRMDHTGTATQIGQDFSATGGVGWIAADPSNKNILWCTTADNRVWRLGAAVSAGPASVWTEITAGRPALGAPNPVITSMCVTPAGDAYVMLNGPMTQAGVTSPLFHLDSGGWTMQASAGLPARVGFGHVIADAVRSDTLYVTSAAKVWQLRMAVPGVWGWTDMSAGLPGTLVRNLTAVKDGTTGGVSLLRAALSNRGVWEKNMAEQSAPRSMLYLRDHPLDLGWSNPSVDGVANPYRPAEKLWHYQCADIKIDPAQFKPGAHGPFAPVFFQTDPEVGANAALDHVRFSMLRNGSIALPQQQLAQIHVQVHNHSVRPSETVWVWAIFARASAGAPSLAAQGKSVGGFRFWSQFESDGTIVPNLPADSPWQSVGAPVRLGGIKASRPQVASWFWNVPTLSSGDPGHYCVVAFVHSRDEPVGETARMNVDEIVPSNHHVGQLNVHIGPPLPPAGHYAISADTARWHPYLQFHGSARPDERLRILLDLNALPEAIRVSFMLAGIRTEQPISRAVRGIARARAAEPADYPLALAGPLAMFRRRVRRFVAWLRSIVGLDDAIAARQTGRLPDMLDDLRPIAYEAAGNGTVEIEGVRLEPFDTAAMLIRVENTGTLEPGSRFRFEVQQYSESTDGKKTLAGGATFEVVIAGTMKAVAPDPDVHEPEIGDEEEEEEELDALPLWIREEARLAKRERARRLGNPDEALNDSQLRASHRHDDDAKK